MLSLASLSSYTENGVDWGSFGVAASLQSLFNDSWISGWSVLESLLWTCLLNDFVLAAVKDVQYHESLSLFWFGGLNSADCSLIRQRGVCVGVYSTCAHVYLFVLCILGHVYVCACVCLCISVCVCMFVFSSVCFSGRLIETTAHLQAEMCNLCLCRPMAASDKQGGSKEDQTFHIAFLPLQPVILK